VAEAIEARVAEVMASDAVQVTCKTPSAAIVSLRF
jgi:hypothetical protein